MALAPDTDRSVTSKSSRNSVRGWGEVLSGVHGLPVLVISGAVGQSASRVNGIYELRSATSPQTPPCFQHRECPEIWLYVATDDRWWVSTEQNKEVRACTGWAYSQTVKNNFPRSVGVWGVVRDHGRWDKQALKVALVSLESVLQVTAKAWASALVTLCDKPVLVVTKASGAKAHLVNGTYYAAHGTNFGEPPIFHNQEFPDSWLYVAQDRRWWISSRKRMEERSASGWAYTDPIDAGVLPALCTGWMVTLGGGRFDPQQLQITPITLREAEEMSCNAWCAALRPFNGTCVMVVSGAKGRGAAINGIYDPLPTTAPEEPPAFRHRHFQQMHLCFGEDRRWWISASQGSGASGGWAHSGVVRLGTLASQAGEWKVSQGANVWEQQDLRVVAHSRDQFDSDSADAWQKAIDTIRSKPVVDVSGAVGPKATLINGHYVLDPSVEPGQPPSFRKMGDRDTWLYLAGAGMWVFSSSAHHVNRESVGWARSAPSSPGTLPTAAEGWEVFDTTSQWQAQDLNFASRSSEEVGAHAAGAWRKAYSDMRNFCLLELTGASGAISAINGTYELRPSYVDRGTMVYRHQLHNNIYLYPGKDNRWWVSDERSKDTGEAGGWACSDPVEVGTVPTQATNWCAANGDEGDGWQPQQLTFVAKPPEDTARVELWSQAVAQLNGSPFIKITGASGERASVVNGLYELDPTSVGVPGEPPAFRGRGGGERWLFFARDCSWWIGSGKRMLDSEPRGWARSNKLSHGFLPTAGAVWKVCRDDGSWEPQDLMLVHVSGAAMVVEDKCTALITPRGAMYMSSPTETTLQPEEENDLYLVDNSSLMARTLGLRHRTSRSVNDLHPTRRSPWGCFLEGVDMGDGWLRSSDGTFLPFSVSGVPVLKRLESPKSRAKSRPSTAITVLQLLSPENDDDIAKDEFDHVDARVEVPKCPHDWAHEMEFVLAGDVAATDVARRCTSCQATGGLGAHWACGEHGVNFCVSCKAAPVEAEFILDNSKLQAASLGVRHRSTRSFDDLHERIATPWGETLLGTHLGRGWVATSIGTFVPKCIDGTRVLLTKAEFLEGGDIDRVLTAEAPVQGSQEVFAKEEAGLDPDVGQKEEAELDSDADRPPAEAPPAAALVNVEPEATRSASPVQTTCTGSTATDGVKADDSIESQKVIGNDEAKPQGRGVWSVTKPKDEDSRWVGAEAEFVADNSLLQAPGKGIRHRLSRKFDDYHPRAGTKWGKSVRGLDLGDGWIQVTASGLYVPTDLNGVRVMLPKGAQEEN